MIQINSSSRHDVDKFEERRKYPRVMLDKAAILSFPGELTFDVTIYDISEKALQLRFKEKAEDISRQALQCAETDGMLFSVNFMVTLNDSDAFISLPCSFGYISQLDQDTVAMGLQFSGIEGEYESMINQFIEASLEPL
jgi:hypothetical protein